MYTGIEGYSYLMHTTDTVVYLNMKIVIFSKKEVVFELEF